MCGVSRAQAMRGSRLADEYRTILAELAGRIMNGE